MIHLYLLYISYTSPYIQVSNPPLDLWDPMCGSHKSNGRFENEMRMRCIYIISLRKSSAALLSMNQIH
jgi:hypothetical protein